MTLDDPMELLLACHDKVRHFTALADKLAVHVTKVGADEEAVSAAKAVIRYFDVAAPLHHADEELDLFPALGLLGDGTLQHHLAQLALEHESLNQGWMRLHLWLDAIVQGQASDPGQVVRDFTQAYRRHADDEETLVYPSAQHLSVAQRAGIAQQMVKRRSTA
jgi:hemerythrin-like domain-containing protein